MLKPIFFFFLLLTFVSCGEAPTSQTETQTSPTEEPSPKEPARLELTESYLIHDRSVFGIRPGDTFEQHADKLEKGLLRSGEGEFEVYYIKSDTGEELGFVYAEEVSTIFDIYLTSPLVTTKEGLKIGSNYGALQKAMPDLEVHGSEIESRVTAFTEELGFLLDTYSTQYDMDENAIDPATQIKMIIVWGSRD